MEFVVNKVMNIDKDAEIYRKKTEELLIEKQKELDEEIKILNKEWEEEAKNSKKRVLEEKLKEAEEKASIIRNEKEEQLNSINLKYNSSKDKIVYEVFHKIIDSL